MRKLKVLIADDVEIIAKTNQQISNSIINISTISDSKNK